jgi:bacteriorhodopsin
METLWLVIGTIVMIGGAIIFAFMTINAPRGSRHFFVIMALVALVAFIAYLSMATGRGVFVAGGQEFYQARYIDWLFTTPLLVLVLCLLALPNPRQRIGLIAGLIVLDVFMILVGWWAGATVSGWKYVLWFIALIALIALLYSIMTRLYAASADRPQSVRRILRTLSVYVVIVWSLYPVVWLIGTEGIGAVSLTWEVFLFLVLDILAKIGFGFLLLTNRQALSDIGAAGAQAGPGRVS